MRLDTSEALRRFDTSRRCVLTTMHPERGADSVPAVYVRVCDVIFIPVDTAKTKRTTRLQRLRNIELDPRVVLLADGWDEDWAALWWVRIHGRAEEATPVAVEQFLPALLARYPQYGPDDIAGGIVIAIETVRGWAATG